MGGGEYPRPGVILYIFTFSTKHKGGRTRAPVSSPQDSLQKLQLLTSAKPKVKAGHITEIVLIVVALGSEVLEPGQQVVQLDRAKTNVVTDFEINAAANSHGKASLSLHSTEVNGLSGAA